MLPWDAPPSARLTAGPPLAGTEVRVVRDDGTEAAPAEGGEILVRGPTISSGYWDDPQATRAGLRKGWLHTGDLGTWDPQGNLVVLARRTDLFVSG